MKLQAELDAARAEMESLKQSLSLQAAETNQLKQEQTIAATVKLELEQVARTARAQIENESAHTAELLQARLEAAELAVAVSQETVQSLEDEFAYLAKRVQLNSEIAESFREKLSIAESELLKQENKEKEKEETISLVNISEEDVCDDDNNIVSQQDKMALMQNEHKAVQAALVSYQHEMAELSQIITEAKAQMLQKVTTVNAIKKDQTVLRQETVLKAEREKQIRERVATAAVRLEAEKREQLLRESAAKAEHVRQEEARAAAALQAATAAKSAEDDLIAQQKQRVLEEAALLKAAQKAVLEAQIAVEENQMAESILSEFDLEVVGDIATLVADLAVKECQIEVEAALTETRVGVDQTSEGGALVARAKLQAEEDEAKRLEAAAKYEVKVIQHLGPTAESFFIEVQKECIYQCWLVLRDGLLVQKHNRAEDGSNARYLHVDLHWQKLYWRNKLARTDEKKASKKTSLFGKSYGDREMLLRDVSSLKRHDSIPYTLHFQCDLKNRSYVFEIGEGHFELVETALHLVLDFLKFEKNGVDG
jgi:hypothetical protein